MEAGARTREHVPPPGRLPAAAPAQASSLRRVVRDYVDMTKPRVQSLLLFTTVTTMYVAGTPALSRVLLTCLGGALASGGAGAINHFLDRDIDARMTRTASRPLPSGRVSPAAALGYGIALGLASFALLERLAVPVQDRARLRRCGERQHGHDEKRH